MSQVRSNVAFSGLLPVSLSALGVALLTGCGGGGGGGSSTPNPTPTAPPVTTQLFFDDFNGSSLDTSRWSTYGTSQSLQRTRFGNTPQLLSDGTTNFARLRLDSYNPQFNGQFKGTEIYTKQRFARGEGLEYEARLRGPDLPPGIIFAFFSIYDRFNGAPSDATYSKTEIDFEFLTAEQEQFSPAGQRKRLYLNIWNDWNLRDGFDGNDVPDTNPVTDKTYGLSTQPFFDWAQWNTYTIRWYPDRTEYYLNGGLQRTEREVKPDEDMAVHLNMWTGNPDFNQAYSASLKPATSAATGKSYYFDVDYVRVRRLAVTAKALGVPQLEEPLAPGFKSYRSR